MCIMDEIWVKWMNDKANSNIPPGFSSIIEHSGCQAKDVQLMDGTDTMPSLGLLLLATSGFDFVNKLDCYFLQLRCRIQGLRSFSTDSCAKPNSL